MVESKKALVRWLIVGFGVVGLLVLVAELAILPHTYDGLGEQGQYWVGYGVSLVSALAILGLGIWIGRSGISTDRYHLIGGWFVAAIVGFGILNLGFLYFASFSFSAVGAWSWLRWAILLGGASGLILGTLWARSIERGIDAKVASMEADIYQRQRDELEILNQYLRHDIRNHLTVIDGYIEMLSDHVDDAGMEYHSVIEENTTAAIELTQTAGDLAEVLLEPEPEDTTVHIDTVLHAEIDRLESKFPHATVRVEGEVPDVAVSGDELLASVFRNLLSNAVEHNDVDKPRIQVAVDTKPDWVTVHISDNGPGIPDSRKEDIFGQGEKGLESEGTGIGLYLVQTLVDRYGGSVDVEDAEPRGTVFSVRLRRPE